MIFIVWTVHSRPEGGLLPTTCPGPPADGFCLGSAMGGTGGGRGAGGGRSHGISPLLQAAPLRCQHPLLPGCQLRGAVSAPGPGKSPFSFASSARKKHFMLLLPSRLLRIPCARARQRSCMRTQEAQSRSVSGKWQISFSCKYSQMLHTRTKKFVVSPKRKPNRLSCFTRHPYVSGPPPF